MPYTDDSLCYCFLLIKIGVASFGWLGHPTNSVYLGAQGDALIYVEVLGTAGPAHPDAAEIPTISRRVPSTGDRPDIPSSEVARARRRGSDTWVANHCDTRADLASTFSLYEATLTNIDDSIDALENQIYRQDDDGTGKPRYFFVARMVEFARGNLPLNFVKADPARAERMVVDGVVDAAYVIAITGKERFAPIVVCLGAEMSGGDLLVDGNHRYVALTLAKHERGLSMEIPAFLIERQDWERFIVPDELITSMGLKDPASASLS